MCNFKIMRSKGEVRVVIMQRLRISQVHLQNVSSGLIYNSFIITSKKKNNNTINIIQLKIVTPLEIF